MEARHYRIDVAAYLPQAGKPGCWRDSLDALSQAGKDGLAIRARVAPQPVGMLYGLELSFHPFALLSSFQPRSDRPLAEKVAAMQDLQFRACLFSEKSEHSNSTSVKTVEAFRFAYPMGEPPEYEPDFVDRIDNRAKALRITPEEYAYDILLEHDGRQILYQPGANYRDGNLDAVRELLGHPLLIVGLADGGAHYGMICDASFPTFFLQLWAREAVESDCIPLPKAISALTSEPADTVGLSDRGRSRVGYKADVNVIDLERLKRHAPTVECDLPAGGKRVRQLADSYVATIVFGEVAYRDGELPGRLVRGQRLPAPFAAA